MSNVDGTNDRIVSPGSTATGSGTSRGEEDVTEETPQDDPSVS